MTNPRLLLPLLLVVLLSATAHGQDDMASKRLRHLQKEKIRILKVRREILVDGKGTPRDFFKAAYVNIAKGNREQAPQNAQLTTKCREYVTIARKRRMEKKAVMYERLGKLYEDYAKQNVKVVKAYEKANSSQMKKALAEIAEVERKIVALTGSAPRRSWFTMVEISKVPMPGQRTTPEKTTARND